jgi:hypothetical protein
MSFMSNTNSNEPTDILVPRDPEWKYNYNIFLQVSSIVLYSALLIFIVHNSYEYLWRKKRY